MHRNLGTANRDSLIALDQRVGSLESGLATLGRNVDNRLNNLQSDFDNHFQILNDKLDKRDDRRWVWAPAVAIASLILLTIGGLGTLSIIPVKEDVGRIRMELSETKTNLDYLRGQLHPLRP